MATIFLNPGTGKAKEQVMRVVAIWIIIALCAQPAGLMADQPNRQPLFKIERSKNANIVQYDAQIAVNGKLDKKEPVIAYWIRLAEQGQVKELSWLQKTFAYGFKAKLNPEEDGASLKMSADFGQPIKVIQVDGVYRAMVEIDGNSSILTKIYIDATGSKLSTEVHFIELYGYDLETGTDTYLKFIP